MEVHDDEIAEEIKKSIGHLYVIEQDFEKAIIYFKAYLQHAYSFHGSEEENIASVLSSLCICYIVLGYKPNAIKCSKQLKKYGPLSPFIKTLA